MFSVFSSPDDVEEGQPHGVEDEPRALLADDFLAEQDDPQQGKPATDDINGVGHPKRRDAQHDIAQRAPADGGGHAHDVGAEPVEPLGRCQPDARDGKGHGADELNDDERGGDAQRLAHDLQDVKELSGHLLTTFCGFPSRNARRLSAQVSISRRRASRVAQAMCGVRKALGAASRGVSAAGGSVSMTSAP